MGEGLSTTYPPKSKSKIEIRIEVADRDCNFSPVPVLLCGGAPSPGGRKSPVRCRRRSPPRPGSGGGGPADRCRCRPADRFRSLFRKKCRPEAFPVPRLRPPPVPFPEEKRPFPVLFPLFPVLFRCCCRSRRPSSACLGADPVPLISRTCCRSGPAGCRAWS